MMMMITKSIRERALRTHFGDMRLYNLYSFLVSVYLLLIFGTKLFYGDVSQSHIHFW